MKNPLQQFTESSAESKKRFSAKDFALIALLVLIAVLITIGLIYFEVRLREKVQNIEVSSEQTLDNNDTGQRYWLVDSIEPVNALYKINLSSNAGNIRTYSDVVSFGLSQDREYIALNLGNEIRIIKLIDETSITAQIPSQMYAGSLGESIAWDRKNEHFAIASYINSEPKQGIIWIFNLDGSLHKEIKTELAFDAANMFTIQPIEFSSTSDLLLARTYKISDSEDLKEDGTAYTNFELPIYLTTFDLEGNIKKDLMIRDFSTDKTNVYYKWDNKNIDTISYYIYPISAVFNPSQDYLFTKVRITN